MFHRVDVGITIFIIAEFILSMILGCNRARSSNSGNRGSMNSDSRGGMRKSMMVGLNWDGSMSHGKSMMVGVGLMSLVDRQNGTSSGQSIRMTGIELRVSLS